MPAATTHGIANHSPTTQPGMALCICVQVHLPVLQCISAVRDKKRLLLLQMVTAHATLPRSLLLRRDADMPFVSVHSGTQVHALLCKACH